MLTRQIIISSQPRKNDFCEERQWAGGVGLWKAEVSPSRHTQTSPSARPLSTGPILFHHSVHAGAVGDVSQGVAAEVPDAAVPGLLIEPVGAAVPGVIGEPRHAAVR